eukprot:scaffold119500_cov33-Phaeocystis_antarctica.AAC.1
MYRCAMRQKLCGDKGAGSSSAAPDTASDAAADEDFGATRRRPGPLLPTPAGSAPPAALIAAQTWLVKAEDAAVSGS